MARAHIMRPIIGENGDLLYGATVTVREAGMSVNLAQALYAGPTGAAQLSNPHVATNGVIDFWLEDAQRVSVLVQSDVHSDILVYLDAAPPPEETVRTETPLIVTGEQTPGRVLMAGDKAGEAVWGSPLTNSTGVTPQVTVINESFSRGQDPAGWSFTQSSQSSRDYSTAVPDNQGLLRSLHAVHTGNAASFVLVSPGFTLIEPGVVSMWLRTSLAMSESVALAVTSQAGTKTVLQTLTTTRNWGFYRFPLNAGTYQSVSIEFAGAPVFASGPGHEMWVTSIRTMYGGQVPEHSHPGSGADSVLLGTGGDASGVGAVAVGAAAKATGTNAAAFGYQTQATAANSLAVGSSAKAPAANSVAIGARATGSLANTGWTAVGSDSYVDSSNGTAIGTGARTFGTGGTAIGSGAYVGSEGGAGTAIGSNAQALGAMSLALGNNAVVAATHSSSVAIGNGAATSAAGQIMLGNPTQPARAVVVGNRLYAVGSANLGTDATSRLGFFGSEGTVKPVVTGADGGVIALRNLLGALAGLGLITNSTTP
ncbi:hypothetical protein OG497_37420 [Streptomyces sp. NBC_01242]|uniref:hypothetical protein n=1 Tax=Streptomyces sp. NBC_01242 TaxID=2903795 RepID=UPI00225C42C6|nr:hypothetical protein [Streptomyces sp. NBC_01242]MCX4799539.1 hypothetical protein [Streptomyces sp. NBC_01242]